MELVEIRVYSLFLFIKKLMVKNRDENRDVGREDEK